MISGYILKKAILHNARSFFHTENLKKYFSPIFLLERKTPVLFTRRVWMDNQQKYDMAINYLNKAHDDGELSDKEYRDLIEIVTNDLNHKEV